MAMPNRKNEPQRPQLAAVAPVAPPHAIEAEQAVLGGLLLNPERLPEVAPIVAQADFYRDDHRRIYRHIAEMTEGGETIDALTVADRIAQWNESDQTGGMAYVLELAGSALPSANLTAYAKLIADRAQRRLLLVKLGEVMRIADEASSVSAPDRIARASRLLADLADEVCRPANAESALNVVPARRMADAEVFADELVEDVLTVYGVSVLYGASNSGKTFAAIDLAGAIARGVPWHGKMTKRTAVLYLATESPASVRNRLSAYMSVHDLDTLDVFVAQTPINLFESYADISRVVAEIAYIRSQFGVEVGLIIGDTMARIAAGANENSGEDMGVVMANADRLCHATRCAFLWIHHSGKDEAKGARGWSGIRAHIDTEIEVKDADDDGVHSLEITKQRDLGGKGARFGFRLKVHALGRNVWGNPRTTCVVVSEIAPARKQGGGRPSVAGPAIILYLSHKGAGARAAEIAEALDGTVSRRQVYDGLRKLKEEGKLECVAGIYGLSGKEIGITN